MPDFPFTSVDELQAALREQAYLADRGLATAIYLSLSLGKPLLLEGEAGVGEDRGREGALAPARARADPAAVLRGDRRLAGRSTSGTTRAS